MLDVLQQILNYPVAELIHSLQGYIVGVLAAHGRLKNKVADILVAMLLAYGFISYEMDEQAAIHDRGDSDIMVFLATVIITGIIYTIIHYYKDPIMEYILRAKIWITNLFNGRLF